MILNNKQMLKIIYFLTIIALIFIKIENVECQEKSNQSNQIQKFGNKLQDIQLQQSKIQERMEFFLKKHTRSIDSLYEQQRAIQQINVSMQDSVLCLNRQLQSLEMTQVEQFDAAQASMKKCYITLLIITGILLLTLIVICAVLFTYIRKRIDKMEQKMIYYNELELSESEKTRGLLDKILKDWKRNFKEGLSKTRKKIKKEIQKK